MKKENTIKHHGSKDAPVMENYNLIILDRSGSMQSIRQYAVGAVNETLGTIRSHQKSKSATECSYVTLVEFCGCNRQKVIYNNEPVENCPNITEDDYEPCCSTPLYDAMGIGITQLSKQVKHKRNAAVQVTIITDGYENCSIEYDRYDIAKLIERFKEEGWLFVYMGADHDVASVAMELKITNHLEFDKSAAGVKAMSKKFNACSDRWRGARGALAAKFYSLDMPMCKFEEERRNLNDNFFDK